MRHTFDGTGWVNSFVFVFRVWVRFEFEFIDKQPMKAGQGLKSSLATQKHRKKMIHIHTNETVKTENEFILKGCISGQKQTRLSKQAQ